MANVMNAQEIKEWMYHKFEENAFMKLADISILEVTCGACKMAMDVDPKKHGNRYGVVHGGALFTLADTAMELPATALELRLSPFQAPSISSAIPQKNAASSPRQPSFTWGIPPLSAVLILKDRMDAKWLM